ncbi:MAG TPA: hypothetical protein VFQ44_15230 [Streptosporangiaceae bacterium]|nr:hypothetical protein [Streptosporangiaceae bacterium]
MSFAKSESVDAAVSPCSRASAVGDSECLTDLVRYFSFFFQHVEAHG